MNEIQTCPTCGTTLYPKQLFTSKIQQRIYDFILSHPGCNLDDLVPHIYAGSPKGLNVHICTMRKLLLPLGYTIRAKPGRFGGDYRIVRTSE